MTAPTGSIQLATQVAICIQFLTPKINLMAQSDNCVRRHPADVHLHALSSGTCFSQDSVLSVGLLQPYDIVNFEMSPSCAILLGGAST